MFSTKKNIRTYIHGGDFVSVASDGNLKWLRAQVERNYELNTQLLGPHKSDNQEVKVLNRIIRWTPDGFKYEADLRHAELVIKDLGLDKAKGVSRRGTKEEGRTNDNNEETLDEHKSSEYRAIVARMNY